MFDDIESTYHDVVSVFGAIGNVIEFLLDPDSYIRIFEVLFGMLLIWGALHFGYS